jgi:hypothetical protein
MDGPVHVLLSPGCRDRGVTTVWGMDTIAHIDRTKIPALIAGRQGSSRFGSNRNFAAAKAHSVLGIRMTGPPFLLASSRS